MDNKTDERVELDNNPFVEFVSVQSFMHTYHDIETMELTGKAVKLSSFTIQDSILTLINHPDNKYKKKFIYSLNEDNIFSQKVYDPFNFMPVTKVKMAMVDISVGEYEYILNGCKHKIKKEIEPTNNYMYLLIRR